jgi:hypothetical protein
MVQKSVILSVTPRRNRVNDDARRRPKDCAKSVILSAAAACESRPRESVAAAEGSMTTAATPPAMSRLRL